MTSHCVEPGVPSTPTNHAEHVCGINGGASFTATHLRPYNSLCNFSQSLSSRMWVSKRIHRSLKSVQLRDISGKHPSRHNQSDGDGDLWIHWFHNWDATRTFRQAGTLPLKSLLYYHCGCQESASFHELVRSRLPRWYIWIDDPTRGWDITIGEAQATGYR